MGMLPRSGTRSICERTLSERRPAIAKLWPSPSRTVVSLWRLASPGMVVPPIVTERVGSMSLTSAESLRWIVLSPITVGVNPSKIPNFFHWTAIEPKVEVSGIGNSPPARNRAS